MNRRALIGVTSPLLGQSLGVAGLLCRSHVSSELVAVDMQAVSNAPVFAPYSRRMSWEDWKNTRVDGVLLPTGSQATRNILERGDVQIGEIVMSQSSLCFFDKQWSIEMAAQAAVPVPVTWTSIDEVIYPAFYKQANESGGGARGIACGAGDLPAVGGADLIFQEYIDSPGTYGVGFLAERGRMLATHVHFESESFPRQGGSAVVIEQFDDPVLLNYAQRIVEASQYSGWGLIEFKHCPRRNDYVFMELNAKLWASCEFAFVNQPAFMRMLFGLTPRDRPVRRMVFASLAWMRGIEVLPAVVRALASGARLTTYAPELRQAQLDMLNRIAPRAVNVLRQLRRPTTYLGGR